MENVLKMGYAIEVKYKDGSVYTKYFAINQLQKATNYFNKMNNSIDKNVHKVMSKIAQVAYQIPIQSRLSCENQEQANPNRKAPT